MEAATVARVWGALSAAVGASLAPDVVLMQYAPSGVAALNCGLALLLVLLLALNLFVWRVYGSTFALWHKLKLE
jgi:hypothetical protein